MNLPAIVLAGERPGGNPLARAFGLPAGVLVDVAGKPCVTRVIETLVASRSISGGVICGPVESIVSASPVFAELLGRGPFRWIPPARGPADSALAALEQLAERPVLLTAADHALLTPEIVDTFTALAAVRDADFVVGLVPWPLVQAAYPESRRTVLKFAGGAYCGSNLYLVRTAAGAGLIDLWRDFQALRKQPWKMARAIGPGTLLSYLLGRLHIETALLRIGDLAGCRIEHVEILNPRAAVDVDSVADHALAERILSAC
ncbi:MAG: nucleotidyltransferase family protein [Pseudomonadales bacterium]|nr:nucleotidyltransferase family protein [Pseudomonadales bacterium]